LANNQPPHVAGTGAQCDAHPDLRDSPRRGVKILMSLSGVLI